MTRFRVYWARTFCKPNSDSPANILNPTPHIQNIRHVEHRTSRASHIVNIPHSSHCTSQTYQTYHIPNILHIQHPTFQPLHILNILQPQRLTIPKFAHPEHLKFCNGTSHISPETLNSMNNLDKNDTWKNLFSWQKAHSQQ